MVAYEDIPGWSPSKGFIPSIKSLTSASGFKEGVPAKVGYEPPKGFISIRGLQRIGLDTETKDPLLKEKGPGTKRKDGYIVGVGIGPRSNVVYYPVAHQNLDRNIKFVDAFWDQLRDEARDFDGEVVGANLQYDLDWLASAHGVRFPRAKFRDVQVAEPLLDENKLSYKLGHLSRQYLGEGKLTGELEDLYGPDYIKNMHRIDAGHAATYCVADVEKSMDIYEKQLPKLEADGVLDLFNEIESEITHLLLQMRDNGVLVNLSHAELAYEGTVKETERVASEILHLSGVNVDVWSNESVAHAFDLMGIAYPKTTANKPSFRKEWLAAHPSPLAKKIMEQRANEKIGGTFLKNYILEGHVDSRIFCMFNQLRSDNSGTVSGRFSSSYPNLQNIPTRDDILGPLCRGAFIPEDGMDWGVTDWSQIEYRLLVHYVNLAFSKDSSAIAAMAAYTNDLTTDFHQVAANLTGKSRKIAKNINFGVVYGMGVAKMAGDLGLSMADAEELLGQFHGQMPFLKKIYNLAMNQAETNGEIYTILKRKRRWDRFESSILYGDGEKEKVQGSVEACEAWLNEQRAVAEAEKRRVRRVWSPRRLGTHAALNALLQGSAADLMKKAMVMGYQDGIFRTLVPHLTVHDELDVSKPRTTEGDQAFDHLLEIMRTAIPLKVPVFASSGIGPNWWEAKKDA